MKNLFTVVTLIITNLLSAQKLLIVTEQSLNASIATSLSTYKSDLINEGYSPILITFSGNDFVSLRNTIKQYYTSDAIEGVVLIGNLPSPLYSHDEIFPIDHYYADLNGTFGGNGTSGFTSHTGNVSPEIYVGRIKADNLSMTGKSAAQLINDYFSRNHKFRTGQITANEKALVFVDDEWYVDGWNHQRCLQYLCGQVDLINTPAITEGNLYNQKLKDNYTFIHFNAHSSPTAHFLTPQISNSTIVSTNPNALFYNLIACQNADFTTANNMAGLYLLGNDYGLGVIGTAKSGSMQHYTEFYKGLGENLSLGKAMKKWWLANVDVAGGNDYFERYWYYGLVLLGDPTLTIKPNFSMTAMDIIEPEADANMDAGESPELNFTITHPSFQGTSISGTLSCDDNKITVLNSNATFTSTGNKTWKNTSPFKIKIDPLITDNYTFYLRVQLQNANTIQIKCTAYAPSLYITNYTCLPYSGGGGYNYQLSFDIRNAGNEKGKNITLSLPNSGNTSFQNPNMVNQDYAVNETKTYTFLCSTSDQKVFIDPRFSGDNFDRQDKVLLSFVNNTMLFDMNASTASLFKTYGIKSNWNFNNDWYVNASSGHNGGNCFHYGTSPSGTYKPFAEGALETPFLLINNNTHLKFWHKYTTENEWDGGFVEAWINGSWKVVPMVNGYPGWVCNELMNEYKYHPAFTDVKSTWEQREIDLNGISGYVKFRFHFVSEGARHYTGWFIDDLEYTYQQTTSVLQPEVNLFEHGANPNPFEAQTKIGYYLEAAAHVAIDVYDLSGKKVRSLVNANQPKGRHEVLWDGYSDSGIQSEGVYFYHIKTDTGARQYSGFNKLVKIR